MTQLKKSYMATAGSVEQKWHLIDADGQILGRMAARIATVLQGKHRPTYTPHVDTGDYIVLINAKKIKVTGRKAEKRMYTRYTGYPGGLREESLGSLLERKPEQLVRNAVRRMMPKNKLGSAMLKKLKIYSGPEHQNSAQMPVPFKTGAES